MALVASLLPRRDVGSRLLQRAVGPGRVRALALALDGAIARDPRRATDLIGQGLRHAKHLHSAERRVLADVMFDLIRHRALLERVGADTGLTRWVGWLVWLGLPVEAGREALAAEGATGPDLEACARLDAVLEQLTAAGDAEALALAGSLHPDLAAALLADLGDEAWAFLEASGERGPVVLRVNQARIGREAAAQRLAEAGIDTRPGRWAPQALVVQGRANVVGSAPYREGLVEIQDEASQLVAALVPEGTGSVIDLCAGAGGKTLAIGARFPEASLLACDVRANALHELGKRARRAGIAVRTVYLGHAPPDLPAADVVLVDAPCTGSGVLRRHPERRATIDASQIAQLATRQGEILDRARALIRPGGTLIYATCSVLRAENDAVVEALLGRAPELTQVAPALAPELVDQVALRTSPHRHGTDGFFAAVLRRDA